ncbi:MAG TPA: UvrD-helicase domain-containing protein, partial [Candidatus Nitrosotalea sp.]|nr:UvrD-helicase domain-containing protein [Candidatus Nitrosotalea sp.]
MDTLIPLLAKERNKSGMSFTESQRRAIEVNGNVLVVAGAGAGKTSTLVERCVAGLLDFRSPAGLDEILMVTFTEAAASEMKQRIRARLEKELDSARDEASLLQLEEQRALLDACHIGTLHSFCLRLIREHAHELALDPQISVLTEEQAILLMDETLDELLRKHYAGETADSPAVQELIAAQSGGWERAIRDLIFRLHHYSQTQPDPDEWYQRQLREYRQSEPETWQRWLLDGFRNWRDDWLPELRAQPAENDRAHRFMTRLRELGAEPSKETIQPVLQEIVEVSADWPHGTRKKFHDPIEEFYKDAAFLNSVANCRNGTDPLKQDWDLARPQMEAILCLAEEFSKAFASAKRDQGGLDFHDFEQFALRLLWDNTAAMPRPLAGELRRKFKFVFVDEYQDINPAQDRIIRAIRREGRAGNCFLVGDVKQSIYRFRLANPHIFQRYRKDWSLDPSKGSVISLSDNFRSREMLLKFINPVFAALMREGIGGVTCRKEDELVFAAPETRAPLSVKASPEPRVEVHLRISGKIDENNDEENSAGAEASDTTDWTGAEIEARWIARRLKNLVQE